MDRKEAYFDLGKWHGALIFSSGEFTDFRAYLENAEAVDLHMSSIKLLSADEDGNVTHRALSDSRLSIAWAEEHRGSLSDSLTMHANMLIVTAGAYFENIVFDFLQNYFTHKPKALHTFIGGEDNPGHIKISEVFSFDTLGDLTTELAARGASRASDGPPDKILQRIKTLTGVEIPSDLHRQIVELVLQRNTIAHEIKRYPLDKLDIQGAYNALEELLRKLGLITRGLGLPIYDPGNLLPKTVKQ